jgi:hypothetical protein
MYLQTSSRQLVLTEVLHLLPKWWLIVVVNRYRDCYCCVAEYALTIRKKFLTHAYSFMALVSRRIPKDAAALSQLQPATVSKIHWILFKILKDNDVNYLLGNFKNEGSFYAVWNKVFDDTCKYRSDYSNKPHKAVVDIDDFQKMSTCFPPLCPEETYGEMLLVLPYKVAQVFCLCAGSEV